MVLLSMGSELKVHLRAFFTLGAAFFAAFFTFLGAAFFAAFFTFWAEILATRAFLTAAFLGTILPFLQYSKYERTE